jgi:hypothetical protein
MRWIRRLAAGVAVGALVSALFVGLPLDRSEQADAVVGSQFNAGNIISDAVFYNAGAMSEAQIQTFLQQRVPTCRAGYTCLKDYRETTTNQSAKEAGCAAYQGRAQSAASIISAVARACGINPQVLIVLLEKEQGLVSDTWPTARQYRSATGYGCPDTADCDANYYGFFNQVYNAAWQFKKYQFSPGGRGYQAGRVNTIQWHPNAACGASQVYIENQATAGLYLYTPYRPNTAALNNLYGTGDACSSYGNRNFWRMFNDWFGSTSGGGYLVRSPERANVFLVVGSTKHPIGDGDTLAAYAPLGPLGYVAQSYLDGLTTGRALQRFVGDDGGRLYLVDRGSKYHFDTCARVADFGYNCPDSVRLTPGQIAALATQADLSSNIATPSGIYHVDDGRKAQAIDATALAAAGFTERSTSLSDPAIAALPHTQPIMRDAVYVAARGSGAHGLWYSGSLSPVSTSLHATGPFASRFGVRTLDAGAYALLSKRAEMGAIVEGADGIDHVLTPLGRTRLGDGLGFGAPTTLPTAILDRLPVAVQAITRPAALKSPSSGSVYLVDAGSKRRFPGPEDRDAALSTLPITRVETIAAPALDALPAGPAWIKPGSLVKSPSAAAVYLTDGTTLHHVPSPTALASLPAKPTRVMPEDVLTGQTKGAAFSTTVSCSGARWVFNGGVRQPVSTATSTDFGFAAERFLALEPSTCAQLPASSTPLTKLVRAKGASAVYLVENGQRRHVLSGAVLSAVAPGVALSTADSALMGAVPVAAPLVAAERAIVPVFIRQVGGASVYLIDGSSIRRLPTMSDYASAAAGVADGRIYDVTAETVAGFARGNDWVRPGSIVRADGQPQVYLLDGGTRLYIGSMAIPESLGAPALSTVTPGTVSTAAVGPNLGIRVRCGTVDSIGLGGTLYPVPSTLSSAFSGTYLPISAVACSAFRSSAMPLDRFLRAPTGTVYLMENGTKRHVRTPATLASLMTPSSRIIDISDFTASQFPNGSPIP